MSKGNMLLGYSRGSVGDVVFSRVKGQQVQKARNRNPNNPRTEGQVLQRAQFSSAVKFFQQTNQRFFKYAFESKKENESDYNAYMRYNANNGYYFTKAMAERNVIVPAAWRITQGTLPAVEVTGVGNVGAAGAAMAVEITLSAPCSEDYGTTIGDLSKYLINDLGGFAEGDIFTIFGVAVVTPLELVQGIREGLIPASLGSTEVFSRQIVLNTASTADLSTVGLGWGVSAGDQPSLGVGNIGLVTPDPNAGIYTIAVAPVHSRVSTTTSVSTQDLVVKSSGNAQTDLLLALQTDNYRQAVLNSWNYTPAAILQGNL